MNYADQRWDDNFAGFTNRYGMTQEAFERALRNNTKLARLAVQAKCDAKQKAEEARIAKAISAAASVAAFEQAQDAADAEFAIDQFAARLETMSAAKIIASAEIICGLAKGSIAGRNRNKVIVAARHDAMAIIKVCKPLYSLTQIGRAMGKRDHTTILHGIRKRGWTGSAWRNGSPDLKNEALLALLPKTPASPSE